MHYNVKLRHQGYSKATRKAIRLAARERREDRIDAEIARKALAELDKIGPTYRPDQEQIVSDISGVLDDMMEAEPALIHWPPTEESEYGVPTGRHDDEEG